MGIRHETLAGCTIVLEPLAATHAPGLVRAALRHQSIFEQRRTLHLHTETDVRGWVSESIELSRQEVEERFLPFAMIDPQTARPIGAIWYTRINERHGRCEVGWAWVAPGLRSHDALLEAKVVLLDHAFAGEGIERVGFRVDVEDARAIAHVERLGAEHEGQLRGDHLDRRGVRHDTRLYGIQRAQWPRLRRRNELRLDGQLRAGERHRALQRLQQAREDALDAWADTPLPNGS